MKNKNIYFLTLIFALFANQNLQAQEASNSSTLTNSKDSLSYSFGVLMGSNFIQQGVELNPEMVSKGLIESLTGKTTQLNAEKCQEIVSNFFNEMQRKIQEENEQVAQENKLKGEAFLEENKSKEGIITTASGLQYKIIQAGNDQKPTADSTVSVHYRGTLLDGTEFDSSYKRGEPVKFKLSQVIPGWTEGVQLMGIGAKYIFYIPSNLAYAERGAGGVIPPNATLIFEVELTDIEQ